MSDDPNNGCEGDYDNGRILVIIDMAFTHGRPLLTMTSTRLVSSSFSETRIRVGCPVSRAHKTWSRSFKDFLHTLT